MSLPGRLHFHLSIAEWLDHCVPVYEALVST
jgi:hypothetical protein